MLCATSVTGAANATRTALRCGNRAEAMARWIAVPDTGTLRRVCEGLRGWMVKASTVERECGCAGGESEEPPTRDSRIGGSLSLGREELNLQPPH